MDTRPLDQKLISLQEAEILLDVPISVLLKWNEVNILKPTITHTGQVGYTKMQIEEFLRIKTSYQTFLPQPTQPQTQPSSTFSPTLDPLSPNPTTHPHWLSSSSLLVASIGIVVIISVTIATQQGKLTSALQQYEQGYQLTQNTSNLQNSSTSTVHVNSPIAFGLPTSSNTLSKSEATSAFSKKMLATTSQTKTPSTPSSHQNQVLAATIAAVTNFMQKQPTQDSKVRNIDTTTYANRSVSPTNTPPADDTKVTLSGSPKSDLLASIVGTSQFINTTNSYQPSSLNFTNQLIVMGLLGAVSMLYLIKRPKTLLAEATLTPFVDTSDKMLEIDQKMDGTVVLCVQGKEHKISKPELDSDSDQFIATLMKLVGQDKKEIEYDTFEENRLKFNTPLSRLVTRLGFVGIKRDLFFPRTSKNRVLFRKYITRHDLQAMHVSLDQILRELTLIV